jgi:hypothetical protein
MKFAIYSMTLDVSTHTVHFTPILNPLKIREILVLDVASVEEGLVKARNLLQLFQLEFYTFLGDYDTGLHESSNYYLGQLRTDETDMCDDERIIYRVHEFIPIEKS